MQVASSGELGVAHFFYGRAGAHDDSTETDYGCILYSLANKCSQWSCAVPCSCAPYKAWCGTRSFCTLHCQQNAGLELLPARPQSSIRSSNATWPVCMQLPVAAVYFAYY